MSFEERAAPALLLAAEHAPEVDREGRFPEEAIGALRDAGMLGLTLPTAVGGLGGTPADFLAVTRAIASRCASTAMIFLMHVCAARCHDRGESRRRRHPPCDGRRFAPVDAGVQRARLAQPLLGAGQPARGVAVVGAEKSFVTSAGPPTATSS